MNKYIIRLCVIFFSILPLKMESSVTKNVRLNYSEDDFDFTINNGEELMIQSRDFLLYYKNDVNIPAIPYVPINVWIPSNVNFEDISYVVEKKKLYSNVKLANNPQLYSWDGDNSIIETDYEDLVWPNNLIEFCGTNIMDGNKILSFIVSPFEYDAINDDLYINNIIDVSISLSVDLQESKDYIAGAMNDVVNNLIINSDDFEEYMSMAKESSNSINNIDYIIVSSDSLKESFMPIINWKKEKGIRSEFISIESIENMYSGTSLQVKLKKCLYDYYVNKGLKYVLLGGDDTIIPVMGCYGYVSAVDSTYIDNNIPTDLFYACFDGDFEWNANGNEIYGELSDNINLLPSIYLTRVPIRSETDVNAFAKKLLAYETNPLDYSNTMLMCGCQMNAPYELDSTKSDAEAAGYTLYSEYIKPNWDGKMFRLYDTISDFGYNEEDINLNLNHFQEQLSMGYGFVDMITHGNIDLWALENGSYNAKNALSLISKGSSIITTNSCSTNAFDNTKDPCLSEAFIRNPDSGIIAYLGSSRYSWIYVGGTGRLGVSLQYESAFYDNLFKSSFEEKEFGKIVADAKSKYAGVSCTNNAYRWIQFSLNPIGDPEMPIYTDTPKVFDNVHVDFYGDNLNVETNVEGCRVCVSSSVDNGDSYYHVEYDTDRFTLSDVSQSITVCITKQGYVPYVKTFEHILYIQNMLITGPQNYESDIIKIGSNVTNTMETGPVVFENGEISIKGKSVTIEGGTEVDKQTILKITNK